MVAAEQDGQATCDECLLFAENPNFREAMRAVGPGFRVTAEQAAERFLRVHHRLGHPTRDQRRVLAGEFLAATTQAERAAAVRAIVERLSDRRG